MGDEWLVDLEGDVGDEMADVECGRGDVVGMLDGEFGSALDEGPREEVEEDSDGKFEDFVMDDVGPLPELDVRDAVLVADVDRPGEDVGSCSSSNV